jgi:hypothetical protein
VRDSAAVRSVLVAAYGSVHGSSVRAVRAAVCGSALGSVRAVHAAVCRSALGSVWQCARQCAAVRLVVCVQCARQCVAVRLVVYGSTDRSRGQELRGETREHEQYQHTQAPP